MRPGSHGTLRSPALGEVPIGFVEHVMHVNPMKAANDAACHDTTRRSGGKGKQDA